MVKKDPHLCNSEFLERVKKRFYYGKLPKTDRPSLPMTEIITDVIHNSSPKNLGFIDIDRISQVSRNACLSPCSMMLGMIYIERLKKMNSKYLSKISGSNLFLISMMVASKYSFDSDLDEGVYNDEWAESAGIEISEINTFEREFLKEIKWNLFVGFDDFNKILCNLEYLIAVKQGKERNYFTYTDLAVILENKEFQKHLESLLKQLLNVLVVFNITFFIGVATLLLSVNTSKKLTEILHKDGNTTQFGTVSLFFRSQISSIKDILLNLDLKESIIEQNEFKCSPGCCKTSPLVDQNKFCWNNTDCNAIILKSKNSNYKFLELEQCSCCCRKHLPIDFNLLKNSIINVNLEYSTISDFISSK